MIRKIVVFTGSVKDFESYISKTIRPSEKTIPFMELIQHYNARLRPNESGVEEDALFEKMSIDNCIVMGEDYGSVLGHVLANFSNIIDLNYNMNVLYVHNPPKLVLRSLQSRFKRSIVYESTSYLSVDNEVLKASFKELNLHILGQDAPKKQIIANLYRLSKSISDKPAVMMFYGPSGVGKTESARILSRALGGELLRIQFSMMQTVEAYNYIFGSEHSKNSFARDLLSRETNIILIDEFDKVNSNFYNAFYQLFDEGKYVDINYSVNLQNAVFVCTSNYMTESEIRKAMGPAMFSRFSCCIRFEDIGKEHKTTIVKKWYKSIEESLNKEEIQYLNKTGILKWFIDNADRYDNIRILKTKLENAIFESLAEEFVVSCAHDDNN